jgi:methylmalonyl-CoA mutase
MFMTGSCRTDPMTDPSADILPLTADFPAATQAQWRQLVDGLLKGAPFDRRLIATTYDGLKIQPLYQRSTAAPPLAGRAAGRRWQILQRVDHPDATAANAQVRDDCRNGATGLALVFAGSRGAHGYGIDTTEDVLARTLDRVELDSAGIAIELDCGPQAEAAGRAMVSLLRRRSLAPAAVDIRFGFDPLGTMAANGAAPVPPIELRAHLGRLAADLLQAGFRGPFAAADGRVIHDAGGSEAQELAFVLAAAVFYLRAIEDAGVALETARRLIFFRLSADADQLLTISKFRALRHLWARIEEACGLAPSPATVSAETAWRMMTRQDPYVNMLRATIAVFAAGLAGADAIVASPFTLARGLPDAFARRMARNTQLILIEESNLARVADPAAGTGVIADTTAQLCQAAWSIFQEIERVGGIAMALKEGLIQAKVAAARRKRQAAMAMRTERLTGTSDFPNLAETPVPVLKVPRVTAPPPTAAFVLEPLPAIRLSEPFEHLREASDRLLAGAGSRPKIFLANLGTSADFTARATFAKNFFEVGGIEAVINDGFKNTDEVVAAFKAARTPFACLCSSDEVYSATAVAAATALIQAGARHLYFTGRPGPIEPELTAAGVETFVYAGGNALAILQAMHDRIAAEHSEQPSTMPEIGAGTNR